MFAANESWQRPTRPACRTVRRRAAAMAAVLVCLLVVMLICGTIVRSMLLQQRQSKTEVTQLQALCLLEAATALADAQVRADSEYSGQVWRMTVDAAVAASGVAEVAVQAADQPLRQRHVHIKITYPDDPIRRVVLHHDFTVTLPALGASE